ncbi:hypothetical protein [Pseudonocardia sp. GCM10023141]|uniref:hypothetical protein n=1 Tax=Pseudonocardia sp. GCM10023141 TaxID=3252653 RepID=UPI00360D8A92
MAFGLPPDLQEGHRHLPRKNVITTDEHPVAAAYTSNPGLPMRPPARVSAENLDVAAGS